MELSSLVLRLMTVASFLEFEAANMNNGVQLMRNKALEGIYHWHEVRSADFVFPSEEEVARAYRAPQWCSGTAVTKDEIVVIRASKFP